MRYPGGKGGAGVYQTIINNIPPHDTYIETHLGGGNILEAQQFDDRQSNKFFMRVVFNHPGQEVDEAKLREGFGRLAEGFGMSWNLRNG